MNTLMELPPTGCFVAVTSTGTEHDLNLTGPTTLWQRRPKARSEPSRIDNRFVEVQLIGAWRLFEVARVYVSSGDYTHATTPLISILRDESRCQNDGMEFDEKGICSLCVMDALL